MSLQKRRAKEILTMLEKRYPNATIALDYSNNFELLVSVMLSAQTTDAQVNKVTPSLFKKYKGKNEKEEISNFANVNIKKLEKDISSIGLFRAKSKNIKLTSQIILKKFHGRIPKTMAELLELPGVGRKTANIVLYHAFGKIAGIAVDTHVRRLSKELGFTKHTDPEKIEKDLMKLFEKEDWPQVTHLLIAFGRDKRNKDRHLLFD